MWELHVIFPCAWRHRKTRASRSWSDWSDVRLARTLLSFFTLTPTASVLYTHAADGLPSPPLHTSMKMLSSWFNGSGCDTPTRMIPSLLLILPRKVLCCILLPSSAIPTPPAPASHEVPSPTSRITSLHAVCKYPLCLSKRGMHSRKQVLHCDHVYIVLQGCWGGRLSIGDIPQQVRDATSRVTPHCQCSPLPHKVSLSPRHALPLPPPLVVFRISH